MRLTQSPPPGSAVLRTSGDTITFTLALEGAPPMGRAVLRTSLGGARLRRRELIDSTDSGRLPLALDWSDVPMEELTPRADGARQFAVRLPLVDIGSFHAKCCFFPEDGGVAHWPEGNDTLVKVSPAWTHSWTSIYCAFVRQFGDNCELERAPADSPEVETLERSGYTVIPSSGTFRSLIKRLDTIILKERFRIIQLLPVHPVPTTFARMGRFGSPFAGTDFLSVNPALAEFDPAATPLEQFCELVDAVHARGARIFIDLPANHTGWASTLQTHHPEWFRRREDGQFVSPGAWGTVWEDLVELDYSNRELRSFMASVFEFWCSQGVDGFRCDAGYMVPADVWRYISARVREQYPDTVFLLEGLGGKISVTRDLIAEQGLDWAYSEIFQTEDRSAFEYYLPGAQTMSEEVGPLAHYAETHDNNRLAARSHSYARMRTALSALASSRGCFGITNGVEWFASEKVDVHRASALRWGNSVNQVAAIGRLNAILGTLPVFGAGAAVRMVQRGGGNVLAILRTLPPEACANSSAGAKALVLVNLNPDEPQPIDWDKATFGQTSGYPVFDSCQLDGMPRYALETVPLPESLLAGQVLCFVPSEAERDAVEQAVGAADNNILHAASRRQELRMAALRLRRTLTGGKPLALEQSVEQMADLLERSPIEAVRQFIPKGSMPPVTVCSIPDDVNRVIPLPYGNFLLARSSAAFRVHFCYEHNGRSIRKTAISFRLADGSHAAFVDYPNIATQAPVDALLRVEANSGDKPIRSAVRIQVLPKMRPDTKCVRTLFSGAEVRASNLTALLTNGRGAMAHVRAKWGEVRSQYDALLAANPNPSYPADRQILLPRCRVWVVRHGFSSELNQECMTAFEATSDKVRWQFDVPTGTGNTVALELILQLKRGRNEARLSFARLAAGDLPNALADAESVDVIVRPDVESRSFHCKTKAFTGPERDYPSAVTARADGLRFAPHGAMALDITFKGAVFTSQSEWHYMVGHPDEAVRGQDASTDLFSPGWFKLKLCGNQSAVMVASAEGAVEPTPPASEPANIRHPATLRGALSKALGQFIVRRGDNATVIAGYPWFLDWGRDTFIAMRGMVADGLFEPSLEIIRTFGAFENRGTLPNMICGGDASNRDTTDAQLWYIVAVADLCQQIGEERVLGMRCAKGGPTVRDVILSIADGYIGGTPNGIRMDADSALVYSPSHFTWMDTNYPAGTPRQGYPVEIQALWIAALDMVAKAAHKGPYKQLASKARESLAKYFWIDKCTRGSQRFLSDCLHCEHGYRPAAEAVADDHLRCNQLFAVTLGALDQMPEIARAVVSSSECLLVPGAIRTLAPGAVRYELPIRSANGALLNDPARPYWGRYEGDEDTRRKPAYHNGTAWPWPYPSYAEALAKVYGKSALPAARSLLATALPLLESDCVGHLAEINDGDAPHWGRGCDAQAWSVSEFLRVAIKLGL